MLLLEFHKNMKRIRKYSGSRCIVTNCKNYSSTTGAEISFHRFPKDEILKQKWLKSCGIDSNFNTRDRFICSKHFKEDDFERDLRNKLLNLPLRRLLKNNVFPSCNLPVDIQPEEELFMINESKRSRLENDTDIISPSHSQLQSVEAEKELLLKEGIFLIDSKKSNLENDTDVISSSHSQLQSVEAEKELLLKHLQTLLEENNKLTWQLKAQKETIFHCNKTINKLQVDYDAILLKLKSIEAKSLPKKSIH